MSQLQHTAPQAGIFRRKPIVADSQDSHLERSLGLWQLTAIGIGASSSPWLARSPTGPAGPAVSVSFLIAGVASACAALSYAEFAGMIPQLARRTPMGMPCSASSPVG